MGGKSRVRRTAEEAREHILDAAEAQLRERGPDGLRLQELAAQVGVSHPAILHHFGSRTALVRAVLSRTARRLKLEITTALSHDVDAANGATLLDRISRVLADRGNARMFAWLFLAGDGEGQDPLGYGVHLREIADAVHALRRRRRPSAEPPFEDTLFTVLLAGISLFGNALAGPSLRRSAGLDADPDADRRFVVWLAALLQRHLDDTR